MQLASARLWGSSPDGDALVSPAGPLPSGLYLWLCASALGRSESFSSPSVLPIGIEETVRSLLCLIISPYCMLGAALLLHRCNQQEQHYYA